MSPKLLVKGKHVDSRQVKHCAVINCIVLLLLPIPIIIWQLNLFHANANVVHKIQLRLPITKHALIVFYHIPKHTNVSYPPLSSRIQVMSPSHPSRAPRSGTSPASAAGTASGRWTRPSPATVPTGRSTANSTTPSGSDPRASGSATDPRWCRSCTERSRSRNSEWAAQGSRTAEGSSRT